MVHTHVYQACEQPECSPSVALWYQLGFGLSGTPGALLHPQSWLLAQLQPPNKKQRHKKTKHDDNNRSRD